MCLFKLVYSLWYTIKFKNVEFDLSITLIDLKELNEKSLNF